MRLNKGRQVGLQSRHCNLWHRFPKPVEPLGCLKQCFCNIYIQDKTCCLNTKPKAILHWIVYKSEWHERLGEEEWCATNCVHLKKKKKKADKKLLPTWTPSLRSTPESRLLPPPPPQDRKSQRWLLSSVVPQWWNKFPNSIRAQSHSQSLRKSWRRCSFTNTSAADGLKRKKKSASVHILYALALHTACSHIHPIKL